MSGLHTPKARWAIPFTGVAAILLVLVAPIGLGPTALASAVENAFHGPLFAFIAVGLLLWLRRNNQSELPVPFVQQYLRAFALAVAIGAGGEIAQSFTSTRHAEWIDLVNDCFGASTGLSIYALYDQRRRLRTWTRRTLCFVAFAGALVVLAPVAYLSCMYWQRWHQLPALVTWGSAAGYYFVKPSSANLQLVNLPPAATMDSQFALQVKPLRETRWVGFSIEEPSPDWSSYSQLVIEVINPSDLPIELLLRIDDRAHNNDFDDRFNRQFMIAPRQRAMFAVPLSEVRDAPKSRQLDLKSVSRLVLFQDAERGAHTLYVRAVRLVR